MTAVTQISPSKISPVASGTLTITGTALDVVTSIVVGGNVAPILTQTATQITCTWPKRVSGGVWDFTGGSVDVSLATPSGTVTSSVEYLSTMDGRAILSVNARVAAGSVQNGYFYDWKDSEIMPFNVDPSSWTDGNWKRVISYVESMDEDRESEVAGFRTYVVRARLDCAIPLKNLKNGTQEASLILSDLTRSVMLDIGNSGFTDTTRVTAKDVMVAEGLSCGALLIAGIGYEFVVQHVENDPTQNINWRSVP